MKRLALYGPMPVAPSASYGRAAHAKALAQSQPAMQRCTACRLPRFPAAPVCAACGSTAAAAEPLPETGRLYSFTTIHAAPGALSRRVPYQVGLVDLDEGPRLLVPLFGPPGWQPACDAAIHLFVAAYADHAKLAAAPVGCALPDLLYETPHLAKDPAPMTAPIRPDTTRAILARGDAKSYAISVEDLPLSALPEGDILLRVEHSALNYKDALALSGRAPIIRSFPMVPGIDLAGTVVDSRSPHFQPGDAVLVNGHGLSETRWGGYSQYQSLPEAMVQHRPKGLSSEEAMLIGTAGYTAMLCVMALNEHGLQSGKDAVLITGASGGVGSVALSLLAGQGFAVIAVTGRPEQADFLRGLGATDVISRDELSAGGRALGRERWAGVVDVAGGKTLADAIAQTRYDGIVTSCGMAGGGDLPATVYPFILRGVTLRGIDSVMVPMERRLRAWDRLARELDRGLLARLGSTRDFVDLPGLARDLLEGRLHGRIAIRLPNGG